MYILTGQSKGKIIKTPKGNKTRPTSSRVKKSIFDILGHIEMNTEVLDLFAGSGSLGLEALSNGAKHSTFIENNKGTISILKENIDNCGYKSSSTVLGLDYSKGLNILEKENKKVDIIFIDPPYELYGTLDTNKLISRCDKILNEQGIIIFEHDKNTKIELSGFETDLRKYGGTLISFLRRNI